MDFNPKKHADDLLEAEVLLDSASMLCDGLDGACCQLTEKQSGDAAAGALGLMSYALNKAHELVSEAETDCRLSHGLHYGEEAKQNSFVLPPTKVSV